MKYWYYQNNRMLAKCFSQMLMWGLAVPGVLAAGPEPKPEARVTSIVRVDSRTGRLVRSVAVNPKYLPAKEVSGGAGKTAPAAGSNFKEMVEEAAARHEVDPLLVHSVIQVESAYNQYAVSPKGAQGLMQLMPATARRFGVDNSFDAKQNIEAGVKYLRYLQDMFGDNRLALAAYNAGEGAVTKYGNVPPYAETEQYVYKVGRTWGQARRNGATPRATPAKAAAQTMAAAPVAPPVNSLQTYTDEEGRVHLKTRN